MVKKLTLLFQTPVLLHLQGIWSSTEYVLLSFPNSELLAIVHCSPHDGYFPQIRFQLEGVISPLSCLHMMSFFAISCLVDCSRETNV